MKTLFALVVLTTFVLSCTIDETSNATVEISESEIVNENPTEPTETISKDITAEEFHSLIENNSGVILDVRTAEEFQGGAINNAVNMDYYASDFSEQLDALDKTTPVYVYCKSGGRSGKAKNMLVEKGFEKVYNLIGGYSSWPY